MNYSTIYFKIENENCEETGYVEIDENDEHMPEFFYWDYNAGYQDREIICHKNEGRTGLTGDQISYEIGEFQELANDTYGGQIYDFIVLSDEDEDAEMEIGGLTVQVW